jgi:hypothetical protein
VNGVVELDRLGAPMTVKGLSSCEKRANAASGAVVGHELFWSDTGRAKNSPRAISESLEGRLVGAVTLITDHPLCPAQPPAQGIR